MLPHLFVCFTFAFVEKSPPACEWNQRTLEETQRFFFFLTWRHRDSTQTNRWVTDHVLIYISVVEKINHEPDVPSFAEGDKMGLPKIMASCELLIMHKSPNPASMIDSAFLSHFTSCWQPPDWTSKSQLQPAIKDCHSVTAQHHPTGCCTSGFTTHTQGHRGR